MRKTATATLLASLLVAGMTTPPALAKDGDVTHLLTLAQLKSYCAAAPTRETRARLSRNDGSSIVGRIECDAEYLSGGEDRLAGSAGFSAITFLAADND
ncbi:hypothetical protein [Devosia sp.]|uniref:hypothetical protein n=1 Tax=Devosia sp. TaxID=1871048 RepID=UPI0035AF1916